MSRQRKELDKMQKCHGGTMQQQGPLWKKYVPG